MTERIYETQSGNIYYWTNDIKPDRITLVMLPGLTADHHLFDKQVKVFQGRYNVLTWDAPGQPVLHGTVPRGSSRICLH